MTVIEWAFEEAVKNVYVGTCACMSGRGRSCPIHDAVARLLLSARRMEQERARALLRERADALRASAGTALEAGHVAVPSLAVADVLMEVAEALRADA